MTDLTAQAGENTGCWMPLDRAYDINYGVNLILSLYARSTIVLCIRKIVFLTLDTHFYLGTHQRHWLSRPLFPD